MSIQPNREKAIAEKYKKVLQNDWTISYKTLFAWVEVDGKRIGAAAAVFLSQVHFWRGVYRRPFHKSWWEMQLETGLNREEQKTARKKCGALVPTYRRKPMGQNGKRQDAPVVHYDIDYDLLASLLPKAAENVMKFAVENDRLGAQPHSDWGTTPTPIGGTAPPSTADPTADPTPDSTVAATAAPSPKADDLGSLGKAFAEEMHVAMTADLRQVAWARNQWGREVKASKELIDQYCLEEARAFREQFKRAILSKEKFWRDQPFKPSRLLALVDSLPSSSGGLSSNHRRKTQAELHAQQDRVHAALMRGVV
jgi:hypothetical protein